MEGTVMPIGPSHFAFWTISNTVAATASGVAGLGVEILMRSPTNSPVSKSTMAPLIPEPPTSMPKEVFMRTILQKCTMVGMTEFDVREFRDYAADLAQQAASLISTKRSEITATGDIRAHSQTKTSAVGPVTEVDTAAEEFVVGSIRRDRPDDGIIGEEGANVASSSGVSWVID